MLLKIKLYKLKINYIENKDNKYSKFITHYYFTSFTIIHAPDVIYLYRICMVGIHSKGSYGTALSNSILMS